MVTKKAASPSDTPAPRKRRSAAAAPAGEPVGTPTTRVTSAQRQSHVAVAAYYIAQKQGFPEGCAHAHWAEAEAQIDALIAQGAL